VYDRCLPMTKPEAHTPTKYIDPLLDFAFKRLFSGDNQKDLLIAFLNEVLKGRKEITDLVYNKNDHSGEVEEIGGAVFDLLCTGKDGENFIVEVQKSKQLYFKERALFYTSRLISDQAPKGDRGAWAYELTEVFFIALLENFSLEKRATDGYLHEVGLCDVRTGKIFYDKLRFTYIELLNFVKSEKELETELDKWLYVMKHMSRMDTMPVYFEKSIFEKLFNLAEYTGLTKEEKNMYDISLKRKWDNQAVIDYARHEGIEIGVEKGMEKGIYIVARKMIQEGMALEQVSKYTGISIAELRNIQGK
jgi:predicted transposase/invertase (TIGR01784 family)